MNLEEVDRELEALGPAPEGLPIERVADLDTVDGLLASLAEGSATASAPRPAKPAPAPRVPAKPVAAAPKLPTPKPPAPTSAKPAAPKLPTPKPPAPVAPPSAEVTRQVVASEPPPSISSSGSLSADDLFADLADDDAASASEAPSEATSETTAPEEAAAATGTPLADLFSDLDEEVADVGNLFEEEAPSEDRLSLDFGELDDGDSEVENTSLFSAADVAAIRRASSAPPKPAAPATAAPPAPPSVVPPKKPTAPPPPPPAVASPIEELVLDDDFELLIDDEEDGSTFVGDADELELAELRASNPSEEPSDDDEPDPDGKKGFFKKLFG
ncbi:MAG: hypothetical protein H6722_09315 [Sandaracinus sp.]|nr:hypothetical protein [Sandaracinus sp.]